METTKDPGVNPQLLIPSKPIVNTVSQASFPVVDSRGFLYVFYEDFTGPPPTFRSIRLVRSFDGGQTFSPPIFVSPVRAVFIYNGFSMINWGCFP